MASVRHITSVEIGMLKGLLSSISQAPRFQAYLMRELFGQHIGTPADITVKQWAVFEAAAYRDAAHNDLRINPAFSAKLGLLAEQFREHQLGQLRLPGL